MSHNYVREWREFEHLTELPCLEDLVFIGNPLEEESSANGKNSIWEALWPVIIVG